MPTQRYKLTIAYRGTHYHGWQRQAANDFYKGPPLPEGAGIPTIQEALTNALTSVVRHPVNIVGSSRTDAGVHAKGQVAHFDTDKIQIPPEGLRRAANSRLPEDIVIRKIEPVPPTFDAVFSTTSKRYQYFIWNTLDRNPFMPGLAWHRWQELDVDAMQEAAKAFVGTHDFASFAKPGHGKETTIRTVFAFDVTRRGPRLILAVEGSGFLWNMVRIMVGTLVEVGMHRHKSEVIAQMLAAKDRRAAGPTAPPQGLYLQWIKTRVESAPRGVTEDEEDTERKPPAAEP